jgi:allantoinase
MTDIVIRGGTLVTGTGAEPCDLAIEDGVIAAIAPELPGGREEIDARQWTVLPGVLDVHVHFNEPGRTNWEGAASGSRALAAGGGTGFFDMPLNSTPCTVEPGAFDTKRAALETASVTDFGLWGGLVPGHVPDMPALAERGVVGFKAFMADSGLPEFPRADDMTLLDGMRVAAQLGLPVAVHAESEELTRALAAHATGRTARDMMAARPVVAELDAIQRSLLFAEATGAALHIVHVSTGRGVALAAEARARGVNVSIETCPHYLCFTDEDVERLGNVLKCAPPLRPRAEQEALWRELLAGHVDLIGSDHSPCEPSMKAGDYAGAWGGIAGVQSTLSVLIERGHFDRGLPLAHLASLLASTPARRFRIPGKGVLAVGCDADLVLVELDRSFTLGATDLLQRHRTSPYIGATFRGRVRRTIRRGDTIFRDGIITARTPGRLMRPARTTS